MCPTLPTGAVAVWTGSGMMSAGSAAAVTQPRRRSRAYFHFRVHVYSIFDLCSNFYVHGILKSSGTPGRPRGRFLLGSPRLVALISHHVHPSLLALGFVEAQVRNIHSRLIQIILGHCRVGEYCNRFAPSHPTSCPCGEAEVQTIWYVVIDCPSHLGRGCICEVRPNLFTVVGGSRE
jgi:hypothetical protein